MSFIKLKQLCVKFPKREVMGERKPLEIQEGTCIIDVDAIVCVAYQIPSFPSDSQEEKELDMYCDKNHIKLVKMAIKPNFTFANVILPYEGYFEKLLNIEVQVYRQFKLSSNLNQTTNMKKKRTKLDTGTNIGS